MKTPWYVPASALPALLIAACGAAPAPGSDDAARAAAPPSPAAATASGSAEPVNDPGHYTSLEDDACRVVKVYEETGGTISRCPGLGGFELMVQDFDARMSIDVIAPEEDDGEATPLRLASLVGNGAFSSLGPRAEWRLGEDGDPVALIVRFNVYEDPQRPDHPTSYLVVTRLGGHGTCVIAKLQPGPGQNERAREMAVGLADAPCLEQGAKALARIERISA